MRLFQIHEIYLIWQRVNQKTFVIIRALRRLHENLAFIVSLGDFYKWSSHVAASLGKKPKLLNGLQSVWMPRTTSLLNNGPQHVAVTPGRWISLHWQKRSISCPPSFPTNQSGDLTSPATSPVIHRCSAQMTVCLVHSLLCKAASLRRLFSHRQPSRAALWCWAKGTSSFYRPFEGLTLLHVPTECESFHSQQEAMWACAWE